MNPRRERILRQGKTKFEKHIGHILRNDKGEVIKLAEVVVNGNFLMFRGEGEPRPASHFDEWTHCSCDRLENEDGVKH